MDGDAAGRQRQRDSSGSDAELQRPATSGELGQDVDHRANDAGLEHFR